MKSILRITIVSVVLLLCMSVFTKDKKDTQQSLGHKIKTLIASIKPLSDEKEAEVVAEMQSHFDQEEKSLEEVNQRECHDRRIRWGALGYVCGCVVGFYVSVGIICISEEIRCSGTFRYYFKEF